VKGNGVLAARRAHTQRVLDRVIITLAKRCLTHAVGPRPEPRRLSPLRDMVGLAPQNHPNLHMEASGGQRRSIPAAMNATARTWFPTRSGAKLPGRAAPVRPWASAHELTWFSVRRGPAGSLFRQPWLVGAGSLLEHHVTMLNVGGEQTSRSEVQALPPLFLTRRSKV